MKARILTVLFIGLTACLPSRGQDIAVKSNLLYDAALTLNAGVEVGVAPRWSVDLSGNWNSWDLSGGRKWKHWMLQPELRYWLCERMNGHFFGVHAHGGQFNWGHLPNDLELLDTRFWRMTDHRFQGWFVGGGIAYGYAWILNRHWNLEAEVGFGYSYVKYDVYECAGCGKQVESDKEHHYVGPTKAAVNLVYTF